AGSRLRVVVLLPVHASDGARRAIAGLLPLPSTAYDLMFATVGPKSSDVVALLETAAATVAELPGNPGIAVAKALSNRDPDVLVDMSGLGAAAGPFLAQHPARAIWAVAVTPG